MLNNKRPITTAKEWRANKQFYGGSKLFQTPAQMPGRFVTRVVGGLGDYREEYNPSIRAHVIKFSRYLYENMPFIHSAVVDKSQWVTNGMEPHYTGTNAEWGNQALEFLRESWLPIANINGTSFWDSMTIASMTIDRDGEFLAIPMAVGDTGYPQIMFIESPRIGQRDKTLDIVETGGYAGLTIKDGRIMNGYNRTVAYRILGRTESEDTDISARSAMLAFDPRYFSINAGVPSITSAIQMSSHVNEIVAYMLQTIKVHSKIALMHFNSTGEQETPLVPPIESHGQAPTSTTTPPAQPAWENQSEDPEVFYFKTGDGELKSFESRQPNIETMEFLQELKHTILDSIGWKLYALEEKGGASIRAVQEETRMAIASRQAVIEKVAKFCICFAITRAMNMGLIPQNNEDWYKWSFYRGPKFSVDLGHENDILVKQFELGAITLDGLCTLQGKRWNEQQAQKGVELNNIIELATKASKNSNGIFTPQWCADYICKIHVNPTTANTTPTSLPDNGSLPTAA